MQHNVLSSAVYGLRYLKSWKPDKKFEKPENYSGQFVAIDNKVTLFHFLVFTVETYNCCSLKAAMWPSAAQHNRVRTVLSIHPTGRTHTAAICGAYTTSSDCLMNVSAFASSTSASKDLRRGEHLGTNILLFSHLDQCNSNLVSETVSRARLIDGGVYYHLMSGSLAWR